MKLIFILYKYIQQLFFINPLESRILRLFSSIRYRFNIILATLAQSKLIPPHKHTSTCVHMRTKSETLPAPPFLLRM